MRELTDEEVLKILPQLSPVKFTLEKSSRHQCLEPYDMLLCRNGWSFVGWTWAARVEIREACPFVCMFEQEDGLQAWCHSSFAPMEIIAYSMLEKNPQLLEPAWAGFYLQRHLPTKLNLITSKIYSFWICSGAVTNGELQRKEKTDDAVIRFFFIAYIQNEYILLLI